MIKFINFTRFIDIHWDIHCHLSLWQDIFLSQLQMSVASGFSFYDHVQILFFRFSSAKDVNVTYPGDPNWKEYLPEKDRKHCTHRDTLPRFVWEVLIPEIAISSHWEYAIAFHPLDFPGRLRAGRDYIIGILQKYSVPLVFGAP